MNQDTQKTKLEWLEVLESQSWQAELIASGLAIYGSLSLEKYLVQMIGWSMLHFDDYTLK